MTQPESEHHQQRIGRWRSDVGEQSFERNFGYAQTTGKEGVYTVVPGPGLLNSTAALCTAWACNSPVLALSGQVHLAGIDSGYGHLH